MKSYRLELIVFICGATVMIYELVGSRVLAPYLGTSTFVWTSLIGVILGSLSFGYWSGGRIADRKPQHEVLGGLIFLAAAIVGVTTYLSGLLLDIVGLYIKDLRISSVVSSTLLFAPASILLGMVSPYSVKLKSGTFDKIASTVGDLYAFSTIGSIFGTFMAGFYLIPRFGTHNILVMISFTLTAVAIIALPRGLFAQKIFIAGYSFAIYFGGNYLTQVYNKSPLLADVDTEYSRVQITNDMYRKSLSDPGTPVRLMHLSNVLNSAVYHDKDDLFLEYTKYFRLVRHFRPDTRKSVMIGGGAFVYPRDFLKTFPNATIDVVEIDRNLTTLARQYFRFHDDPRMQIINEDGRTFLNRSNNRYDVLFCDAFASVYSIPFQLTTQESVRRMYGVLNNEGVALVNIMSAIEGKDGRFLRAAYNTFRSVFPRVYLFPVSSGDDGKLFQNIMLVAVKGNSIPALTSGDPELSGYLRHHWQKEVPQDMKILTDDYAPVEDYISLRS